MRGFHEGDHMMSRTLSRWLMSIILAALALVAINLLVATTPTQARHTSLINCTGSIQACIDVANDGDTILIAAGRYTESLTLSKPVSLTGENRDTTIIHAIAGQRVLTVTGATIDNSVVISGLTFTGGDVTNGPACPTSCGGGIALLDMAQPRVSSLIIQHNQASYGGGLFVEPDSLLLINHSQLISNTAYQGGGIYAGDWYTPSLLAVTNTVFLSNSATDGGGVFINGFASMADVHFENNTVIAMGGGLYARGGVITATRATFINNSGTAFYTYDSPATIIDSHFERNTGGVGGGLWAHYVGANISHTTFISNTADQGGGGVTMVNGSIVNSRFESNRAQYLGGGVYGLGTMFVTNTDFINNQVQENGGGAYFGCAYIFGSRFIHNVSTNGDGGGFGADCLFSLTDSQLVNNTAAQQGGAILLSYSSPVTIINSLLTDNAAHKSGAAIHAGRFGDASSNISLLHSTISNKIFNSVSAIDITTGTLGITNTIIASHTIGISNTGGTVYEDCNLFFGNIANTVGVTSGGHSLVGDPMFIDPLNGDSHLQFGSAAIDRGVNAGVYTDLDGNPRPVGAGFDIGAYEYQLIKVLYLPLIRK
jgi:hypothetical protein